MPRDIKVNTQTIVGTSLVPSTLEDIDSALVNYIDETLNIYCDTNTGYEKVPVALAPQERAYQIKHSPTRRTEGGRSLTYPAISIVRESIAKDPGKKGKFATYIPPYYGYYKRGGSIEIAREVNQEKTMQRANADSIRRSAGGTNKNLQTSPGENQKIVYDIISMPYPTYLEVTYTVVLRSEYQQQMNDIVMPFLARTGAPSVFHIKTNGNVYEAFIEPDFNQENTSELNTDERMFQTTITIRVLGYIIGSGTNEETPITVTRETAAEIRLQRERVILGDEPDFHPGKKEKYRP
jgi:hypothetical protein